MRCQAIKVALRFLTGDFWKLTLADGGYPPPRPKAPVMFDADCVCLLSGGLDSLVGALNLTEEGRHPLLVSQTAKGDKETQSLFATGLGGNERHLQWNQNIRPKVEDIEGSTRGRSIGFFAFAAVAADYLATVKVGLPKPVEVFVPENGLISLNVPLNPGRMGSLSTKTTHPVFMERLQKLWDALGIPAVLRLPYAAMTKGEMMAACQVPDVLAQVASQATSCGRFVRNGYKHCGRCVPCLVRRASFRLTCSSRSFGVAAATAIRVVCARRARMWIAKHVPGGSFGGRRASFVGRDGPRPITGDI